MSDGFGTTSSVPVVDCTRHREGESNSPDEKPGAPFECVPAKRVSIAICALDCAAQYRRADEDMLELVPAPPGHADG